MSYMRIFAICLFAFACLIISQGCNNHFVTATGPDFSASGKSPDYFPLNEGFKTTYKVERKHASSEIISYTVGGEISFHSGIAVEWISDKNGVKDTGYFVYSGNSLLFYESKKAAPQVILTEPLKIGSSWSRFVSDNNDSNLEDTTTIDVQDKGEPEDEGGDGPQQVSYPVDGSEMLVVDKIESVELERIGYLSKVVRISNETTGGAKNYYWYAEGIGMIKYVLGATDPNNPSGSVEAELISYGY